MLDMNCCLAAPYLPARSSVRPCCRACGEADLVLVPVQDPSPGRHEPCGRLRALRGRKGESKTIIFVLSVFTCISRVRTGILWLRQMV